MKRVLALLMLVVSTTTFAVAAGETITMKYDLGAENPKWKFMAGQWVRRPSGGRHVLAQLLYGVLGRRHHVFLHLARHLLSGLLHGGEDVVLQGVHRLGRDVSAHRLYGLD